MSPILLIVWAVLATCFMALLVYRGQLTRYEDDQLFLLEEDDATSHAHKEQEDIVRRVNRLQPLVRLFGGTASLVTASVIGLYVWKAWQTIQ